MDGQSKVSGRRLGSLIWISELSKMAGEVRDRTIIVKINSQLHSWSALDIQSVFSEFGVVEEVKLLPERSRFHSQIRYQTTYDSEWACYYYQDGWLVHEKCCEIQVYRADEIISWNDQRIDKITAANVVSDTPEVISANGLLEETVKHDELMNQGEDSSQVAKRIEQNSAKQLPDLAAYQVFEEMSKSILTPEMKFLDEIENTNDELVDGFSLETAPICSIERLGDVKVIEDGEQSMMNGVVNSARMMIGVVNSVCFDPGGTDLFSLAIILPHGSLESEANEEKASVQIASNKAAAKEISYSVANHLFDKISDSSDCHDYQLLYQSRVFSDNYQNQDDSKFLPTPGVRWLVNGAKTKVENSIVLSLTNQQILELHSYYSMSGGAHAYLVELLDFNTVKHNNSHSAEELTIMTNSLVTNEIFLSAYDLSFDDITCLGAFCFDPSGKELLCTSNSLKWCCSGMNLSFMLKLINVHLLVTTDISCFGRDELMQFAGFNPCYQLLFDPGGELIFVLQIEGMPNGGEFVLVIHAAHFEIIMNEARNKYRYKRAATWSVVTIYVQQVFLFGSFQAMGLCSQVMCDILTWLHGYKSKVSPVYKLVGELNLVNGKIFCYAISLLLDLPTQIRTCHLDAFRMINESSLVFVFDPGGHCSRLSAQAHCQIARRLQSRVELLMMLLLHLYGFATEFVILEDKDPLKRGVL